MSSVAKLKPGPFQIIEQVSLETPCDAPKRRYDCANYETCLNLAAAMNWDSFTCRGCNCQVNSSLLWRAQQEIKKDSVVKKICSQIPEITMYDSLDSEPKHSFVTNIIELKTNRHSLEKLNLEKLNSEELNSAADSVAEEQIQPGAKPTYRYQEIAQINLDLFQRKLKQG